MRLNHLSLLAAVCPFALAMPKFSTPAPGSQQAAGTIQMQWSDDGDSPAISDLSTYQIFLMFGGNEDGNMLQIDAIQPSGKFSTGNVAQGTIDPATGPSEGSKNGYFLKMIAVATEGGTVTIYSDRFTVTGMAGGAGQTYIDAVPGGTKGPANVDGTSNDAAATTAPEGAGDVPYALQTGLTKYAPMQPVPRTKITAKGYTPLYSTSSIGTVATTFLPAASIVTTITASQTFSVSSMENTASPASNPNPDMVKFLNRWKD